jgi:hypothetical protein
MCVDPTTASLAGSAARFTSVQFDAGNRVVAAEVTPRRRRRERQKQHSRTAEALFTGSQTLNVIHTPAKMASFSEPLLAGAKDAAGCCGNLFK